MDFAQPVVVEMLDVREDELNQNSPHLGRMGYGYIALLLAFASISTDLYLPAMPTMAKLFGVEDGVLEFSVTGYLAGFALGQLF